MSKQSCFAALALVALGTATASASLMIQPSAASTNMGNFSTYDPMYAINQSALSSPYVSGVTNLQSFAAATNTVGGGSSFTTWYSSAGTLAGNFDLNLGGTFTVDSLVMWADPQGIGQSVNGFTLLAANNAAFTGATVLGSFNAADRASNASNFGQVFSFAPTPASFLRLQIAGNHGSTLTTGIVEIAAGSVVPEPGMCGLGLAGTIALAARRRR